MTRLIPHRSFRDFLHDSRLNAIGKIDGYRLSQVAWDEAVLDVARIAKAAQEVAYAFECHCDDAYTKRGLHGPNCLYEEGQELREALAAFQWEACKPLLPPRNVSNRSA